MEARRVADSGGAVFSLCRDREQFWGMGCIVCQELGELDAEHGADDAFVFLCRTDAGEMGGATAVANDRRDSIGAGGITHGMCGYGGPGFITWPARGSGECLPC